jgi:DNA-binding CsgD family transcriptional regulator
MDRKSESLDIYQEVFRTYQEFSGTVIEDHIKRLQEIDRILPPSSTFFIVTNTSMGTFEFVSKNFEYALGLDREKMLTEGVPYWLSHIHPEDLPVWIGLMGDLMNYTMAEIRREDRMRVQYQWNFRVRTDSGLFANLVEQQVPLFLDELGKPIIGIGHLSVLGFNDPMPIRSAVRIMNEKQQYETLRVRSYGAQKALSDGLSERERDVIRLLALGNTSKEIAEKLFLSPHTVDTHRRRILKKLNCSSTAQAVAQFKGNGFI